VNKLLASLSALVVSTAVAATPPPLVFAAASLTEVLQQIGNDYTRTTGRAVRFSFGSTATMARQIESGAAAELFVAADVEWMDYVQQRGLIEGASRTNLLGNELALIAPSDQPTQLALDSTTLAATLAAALGRTGRLAVADPASVPAGRYAKAALESLGAWPAVQKRLAMAENVRTALMYVARGEAPLGIVYFTDARAEPRVRVVARFPADTHAPIIYPVALTKRASPEAAQFLAYLQSGRARALFEAAGFRFLAPKTAGH